MIFPQIQLFADDTSLFSVVNNIYTSATNYFKPRPKCNNQLGFPMEDDFH